MMHYRWNNKPVVGRPVGCVEFKVRGSQDMMETDESEWEDTAGRDNRSYGMSNNYNYSEGMAPRTYTPPPPPKEETRPEVCNSEEIRNGH